MTDETDHAGGDGCREAEAARLAMVVGQLVRVLRRHAPTDVGPGALAALATVSRLGPMRLGELAVREGVAPPTLTRIVAALEDGGYVTRDPDPADRRAVRVTITDAGTNVVTEVTADRAEVLVARMRQLPAPQQAALAAALPALEALVGDPE